MMRIKAQPKSLKVPESPRLQSLRSQGTDSFHLTNIPLVMGILNVTPDSFSDGGMFLDPGKAEAHALAMEAQGADIIDVGAESTKPGSYGVTEAQELERLIPVLERIIPQLKIPVSVDTSKYNVMKRVLDLGVSVINDVQAGTGDSRTFDLISQYEASVVLMHMRGAPQNMQEDVVYSDLTGEVKAFLRNVSQKALASGILKKRIILDPGIGFGKSVDGNFELIRSIPVFKELGFPVLIGLSRKSFIHKFFQKTLHDLAVPVAALHAIALKKGADILRVHDIIDAKIVVNSYQKVGTE